MKIADHRTSADPLPPHWNTGFYRPGQSLSRRQKKTGRPWRSSRSRQLENQPTLRQSGIVVLVSRFRSAVLQEFLGNQTGVLAQRQFDFLGGIGIVA